MDVADVQVEWVSGLTEQHVTVQNCAKAWGYYYICSRTEQRCYDYHIYLFSHYFIYKKDEQYSEAVLRKFEEHIYAENKKFGIFLFPSERLMQYSSYSFSSFVSYSLLSIPSSVIVLSTPQREALLPTS